jgi:hypothetical protein
MDRPTDFLTIITILFETIKNETETKEKEKNRRQ